MTRAAARTLPRDLYVAASARGVAVLGNEIAITALMLQFYDQGAGGWGIAALVAAGMVPMVVFAPVIGLLIDRYDSRMLIVVSGLWQSASCLLLVFVHQVGAVLTLVALNALGSAVANPVFSALTKLMVPGERLASASAVLQSSNVMATLIGPPVGGLLTAVTGGARVPLLIDAGTFLAITAAGLLINTRRRPGRTNRKPNARAGIALLFGDRALAATLVLGVLLIIVGTAVGVAEVFLVRDTFHASALAFGLLQAAYTAGMLVGTAVASRMSTTQRLLVAIPVSSAIMAASFVVIGLANSLVLTFVLYVVAGAGTGVESAAAGTLLLLRTPEPVLGRTLASFSALLRGAGLLAYGVSGLVVGLFPPETVFLLSGTAALLAVLAATPALRRAWSANG